MPGRRTERRRGIVLDHTKLAEKDRIVTLLSLEGEQLRGVAKGARKPGGRLCARTERFCDVDVLLSYGRGLPIVSEAQIVDAHAGVRGELERFAAASALCEVARLTCYENVVDPFLHPILDRALRAVEEAQGRERLDLVVAAYAIKVLSHGGWRPELDACVSCGEPSATRFSVQAGGTLCESCARSIEGAEPVGEFELGWMRALVGGTFDALLASSPDAATAGRLVGIAHAWAATHLDSRLRSMEFYVGT